MDLLPRATGSCLNTANWTQYPLIKCSLSLLSRSGTLRAPFGACRRLRSDGYLEVIHADDEQASRSGIPGQPEIMSGGTEKADRAKPPGVGILPKPSPGK